MTGELSFKQKCESYLKDRWDYILTCRENEEFREFIDDSYVVEIGLIQKCLCSKTKSYRYVLPTQLLCKSVNHSLDCRSLQAADESEGAFDARTIAHGVIVPFDYENYNVLGGSPEPYVNNPLRCPAVSPMYRQRQKNKRDWDSLIHILKMVQETDNHIFTKNVFDQVLYEISNLLEEVRVIYPTPNRISLGQTRKLINDFLSVKSGGDRLEAVATSLFRIIADKFNLFDEIKREKVNTADASSGMVADIECFLEGRVVLLVEVKDTTLSLTQLNAKVDTARSAKIREILFIVEKGIEKISNKEAQKKIGQEFTSGQNVYVSDLMSFAEGILTLIGENGRVDFIREIGQELDRVNSPIKHRKAWAFLLKKI